MIKVIIKLITGLFALMHRFQSSPQQEHSPPPPHTPPKDPYGLFLPLPAPNIQHMKKRLESMAYNTDRLQGANFWETSVPNNQLHIKSNSQAKNPSYQPHISNAPHPENNHFAFKQPNHPNHRDSSALAFKNGQT